MPERLASPQIELRLECLYQALNQIEGEAALPVARRNLQLALGLETDPADTFVDDDESLPAQPGDGAEVAAIASPSELDALIAVVGAASARQRSQPFFTIRIASSDGDEILMCPSGHEPSAFVTELAQRSSALGGSPLLDALRFALQLELYSAGFAFFEWVQEPAADAGAVFFHWGEGETPFPEYCGYPIIDLCTGNARNADERRHDLVRLFDALDADIGNNQMRIGLLEAVAFALARHFGSTGQYEAGLHYIDRALTLGGNFLHLATSRHVLDAKLRGLPVAPRLEKFAGPDRHALDDRVCANPFRRFEINPGGTVRLCCAAILPTMIGNIVEEEADAILNSDAARNVRASMLDGSFRYCDHLKCPVMVGGLPGKSDPAVLADPVMRRALATGETRVEGICDLSFGYDFTCNLSCPSCRRDLLVQKETPHSAERKTIADKLRPLLPQLQSVYLNPSGEFLASRPSRQFLHSIDPVRCPDLRIDIISNGTLFSEREWQKFANVHRLINSVRISIDAASAATFELLRRGGEWNSFLQNLRFIGRLRAQEHIKYLFLGFTYQQANFREMIDFIAFSEAFGADGVSFQRLVKFDHMTAAEYASAAIHLREHPLHADFLDVVHDPVFRGANVQTDFEFG